MPRIARSLALSACLLAWSCGGGDGEGLGSSNATVDPTSGGTGGTASAGSPTGSTPRGAVSSGGGTYSGVAGIGEFVSYSVDFGARSYSYTIVGSAFGLAGTTRSGSLQKNADGTWTPGGMSPSAAKLIALDSGLMLGAIREDFGAGAQTVPILAGANPITSLADAVGIYNFIEYPCVTRACEATWGTLRIHADGTWQSCAFSDFSAGCALAASGSFGALGNGRWQATQAGIGIIGSAAMFLAAGGQKLVLLDFASPLLTGFSIALEQRAIARSDYDGRTWLTARFSPGSTSVQGFSTGTDAAGPYAQDTGSSTKSPLLFNSPFAGFATTARGEHALLSPAGLYAATGRGFVEFGLAAPPLDN